MRNYKMSTWQAYRLERIGDYLSDNATPGSGQSIRDGARHAFDRLVPGRY